MSKVGDMVARLKAAPASTGAPIRQGGVYRADDSAIPFGDPAHRTFHDFRRAIVISPEDVCRDTSILGVSILPCSHQVPKTPDPDCFVIPATEPAFTKPSVALLRVRPSVLKTILREHHGNLSQSTLIALLAAIRPG